MRGVIRLNDPTSHGGMVTSAAPKSKVMGIAVARKGDKITCPLHGDGVITEGDPKVLIDGIEAAFDGHKTSCGAQLITTIPTSGRG